MKRRNDRINAGSPGSLRCSITPLTTRPERVALAWLAVALSVVVGAGACSNRQTSAVSGPTDLAAEVEDVADTILTPPPDTEVAVSDSVAGDVLADMAAAVDAGAPVSDAGADVAEKVCVWGKISDPYWQWPKGPVPEICKGHPEVIDKKDGDACTTVGELRCSNEDAYERPYFKDNNDGLPTKLCHRPYRLRCAVSPDDKKPRWVREVCRDTLKQPPEACETCFGAFQELPGCVASAGAKCCPKVVRMPRQGNNNPPPAIASDCPPELEGKVFCRKTYLVACLKYEDWKPTLDQVVDGVLKKASAMTKSAEYKAGLACNAVAPGCTYWFRYNRPAPTLYCIDKTKKDSCFDYNGQMPVDPVCTTVNGKIHWAKTCEEMGEKACGEGS